MGVEKARCLKMSIDQARRNLNQINKDIAELEKKLAFETKNEADKNRRMNEIQRSINKHTSPSTLQSKTKQIQDNQNDLVRILSRKSELNKKLADKRSKLSDATLKLQREEQQEAKRKDKAHNDIMKSYEHRIESLKRQLSQENRYRIQTMNRDPHFDSNTEMYDVFISHASEDKESFVDELCKLLQDQGVKIWYDTIAIRWGDSLRSKIDEGLKNSKFGIVVISPSYISKGWTQYELDGLFQLEMNGGKVVLPVWHNITKKEVQDFSPSLAGRKALTTATMTPAEIGQELIQLLNIDDGSNFSGLLQSK